MSQFNSVPTGPIDAPVNIMNPTGIEPNAAMAQMGQLSNRRNERAMANQQAGLQKQQMGLQQQQMAQQQRQFDASQQQERNLQAAGMNHDINMQKVSLATQLKLDKLRADREDAIMEWRRQWAMGQMAEANKHAEKASTLRKQANEVRERFASFGALSEGIKSGMDLGDPNSFFSKNISRLVTTKVQAMTAAIDPAMRRIQEALASQGVKNHRTIEDGATGKFFHLPRFLGASYEDAAKISADMISNRKAPFGLQKSLQNAEIVDEGLAQKVLNGELGAVTDYVLDKKPGGEVMIRSAIVDEKDNLIAFLDEGRIAPRGGRVMDWAGGFFSGTQESGWETQYGDKEYLLQKGYLFPQADPSTFTTDMSKMGQAASEYLVARGYDNTKVDSGTLTSLMEDIHRLADIGEGNERTSLVSGMKKKIDGMSKDMSPADQKELKRDLGLFLTLVEKSASGMSAVKAQADMNEMAVSQGRPGMKLEYTGGGQVYKQSEKLTKGILEARELEDLFDDDFSDGVIQFGDSFLPELPESRILTGVMQQTLKAADNVELLKMLAKGDYSALNPILGDLTQPQRELLINTTKALILKQISERSIDLDVIGQGGVRNLKDLENMITGLVDEEAQYDRMSKMNFTFNAPPPPKFGAMYENAIDDLNSPYDDMLNPY